MAFMPAAPSDKTLFLVCLVSYTGVRTCSDAFISQLAVPSCNIGPHANKQTLPDSTYCILHVGFDHSQKQLYCLAVHCSSKGHAMAIKITEGTWTVRYRTSSSLSLWPACQHVNPLCLIMQECRPQHDHSSACHSTTVHRARDCLCQQQQRLPASSHCSQSQQKGLSSRQQSRALQCGASRHPHSLSALAGVHMGTCRHNG